MKMKRLIIVTACVITLLLLAGIVFIFIPAPIDPASYSPPVKPALVGVLAPNTLLVRSEVIARNLIDGPETIVPDGQGNIYGGTADGSIVRMNKTGTVERFSDTGGRPLGLMFDRRGNLIVCDAYKGLLSINTRGEVTVLAAGANGVPFRFTDDLDIAANGDIYFSDASYKYSQAEYLFDLLEAKPNGRLLVYRQAERRADVLLDDLFFANGVALSPDEDYVLVNETYRYRIIRYWLKGEKAGERDVFIDNLPGFPDGLSRSGRGTFWAPMFTVRNDILDTMHPDPFMKSLLSKLPDALWPKPRPYGLVMEFNAGGEIIRTLHDPDAKTVFEITAVCERDGWLYLGFLHQPYCARYRLE